MSGLSGQILVSSTEKLSGYGFRCCFAFVKRKFKFKLGYGRLAYAPGGGTARPGHRAAPPSSPVCKSAGPLMRDGSVLSPRGQGDHYLGLPEHRKARSEFGSRHPFAGHAAWLPLCCATLLEIRLGWCHAPRESPHRLVGPV